MVKSRFAVAVVISLVATGLFAQSVVAPAEHRRGPEQTFLTFPEWFLVFSPAEYAEFVRTDYPSDFPFWGHVRQLWQSYAAVTRATNEGGYEFNAGYHVMIMVIGVSTTVEYAIRSAYETIFGRLAELTASQPTAEDLYGARVAQEYVDFIRVRPWYEFDFWSRLTGLWSDVSATGPGLIRKWERRYALTNEYLVKAGYGWLIGIGTHASYERPLTVTAVVFNTSANEQVMKLLPRYEAFTPAAKELADSGVQFAEIAGNGANAEILISVIADAGWTLPNYAHELFRHPIITKPGRQRVAFSVRVESLSNALRDIGGTTVIEHVFDY